MSVPGFQVRKPKSQKNNAKSEKPNGTKPSAKGNPKGTAKNFTVQERPKVKSRNDVPNVNFEEERLVIPVYSNSPSKDNSLDLFLVDLLTQSDREEVIPYFIGTYATKSFDIHIRNSTVGVEPSDLVADENLNEVFNLKRKVLAD